MTLTVAVLSAFMNNVGALALMLPVAIRAAGGGASYVQGPDATGIRILGGLATLIGTPPGIIISSYRRNSWKIVRRGGGFECSNSRLSAAATLAGIAFIALLGYRLIPHRESSDNALEELLHIEDYVTELSVPKDRR